jgi:prepilin peptidase dependent protein B
MIAAEASMEKLSIRTRQLGLSMVETMVGLTVGLFIVGGALKLFVDNLDSNRRLLVETRVNQDLRAAADLIARDLRRASYWTQATSGVWQTSASAVTPNPHAAITTGSDVVYQYDKDTTEVYSAGFRLSAGKIQLRTAASTWQDVTDPSAMTVTQLSVTPVSRIIDLLPRCEVTTCPAGSTTCPPTLTIRQFNLTLQGQAVTDSRVVRQIEETIRVRNDQFSGACPPV